MRFENQTFTDDVTLDYNEFINCEIQNCLVLFHGGRFKLVRTKLKNVRFGVGESAKSTLNFLRMVRASSPEMFENLLSQGTPPKTGNGVTIN